MSAFAKAVGWIPRLLLFAAAAVVQAGLISALVYERARLLREGTEVTLQTRPVDPRDFLRGDYVVLNYEISSVAAGALQGRPAASHKVEVFVKIAPQPDGNFGFLAVHESPVPLSGGEILIRGRVTSGANCGPERHDFCERLQLKFGIERYFVPQGEGRVIESARNQGKVQIVAAVSQAGRAAIKRLLLDGKAVYDELLY